MPVPKVVLQPLGWRCFFVRFMTNGVCVKNNTHIHVAQTSNNRVIPME